MNSKDLVVIEESLIVHTKSGSIYEFRNNQVRRLTGKTPATARTGMDGHWKSYKNVYYIDDVVIIVWDIVDGVAKSTMTSKVVNMLKNTEINN